MHFERVLILRELGAEDTGRARLPSMNLTYWPWQSWGDAGRVQLSSCGEAASSPWDQAQPPWPNIRVKPTSLHQFGIRNSVLRNVIRAWACFSEGKRSLCSFLVFLLFFHKALAPRTLACFYLFIYLCSSEDTVGDTDFSKNSWVWRDAINYWEYSQLLPTLWYI